MRDQRQRAETRLGFCPVFGDQFRLAVQIDAGNRMAHRDGIVVEVNGAPFQPQNLAAAKAIIGGNDCVCQEKS